ncbi:MAG TPA: ABC transporter permease, partial [Caldilineaceae bacterium]|nr:ABC transporter permease [Caldilineaceae bacterium]
MDELSRLVSLAFLMALLTSGIRLAIPIFLAALGEIITERSGVINLGLEGLMLVGALAGFMVAYYAEQSFGAGWPLAPWLGLAAGVLAGMALGLILAILAVSLHTDQVVTSIMLVILGQGITTYIYQQQFSSLTARVTALDIFEIPGLAGLPVVGDLLFRHDLVTYASLFLLAAAWFLLYRTTWGLQLRAAGEHPAAAETSGVNVVRV